MDEKTCYEIIHNLDVMHSYSLNMGRSHNADDWRKNYDQYDKLRQEVINTLKSHITKKEEE